MLQERAAMQRMIVSALLPLAERIGDSMETAKQQQVTNYNYFAFQVH